MGCICIIDLIISCCGIIGIGAGWVISISAGWAIICGARYCCPIWGGIITRAIIFAWGKAGEGILLLLLLLLLLRLASRLMGLARALEAGCGPGQVSLR